MTGVELRPAAADDLEAIVEIFLRCWRESYAAVLPARVIAEMDEESATRLWAGVLTKPGSILLAETGSRVLGVTRFLAKQGEPGHVASLYVSPDSQGAGVGRTLLAAAESGLRREGSLTATLWVFEDNSPSIAFYRSRGWEMDGESRIEPQFESPEIRLSKVLD